MRRIDRFDKYMKVKGLNDNKVTIQLGLSVGTLGKSRKDGRDFSGKSLAYQTQHLLGCKFKVSVNFALKQLTVQRNEL